MVLGLEPLDFRFGLFCPLLFYTLGKQQSQVESPLSDIPGDPSPVQKPGRPRFAPDLVDERRGGEESRNPGPDQQRNFGLWEMFANRLHGRDGQDRIARVNRRRANVHRVFFLELGLFGLQLQQRQIVDFVGGDDPQCC